ncbi:hypothetical protein LCGC14_1672750 [marine sediment metagenome]|uniref:Uncharacterized protein n=1 Tax=marine sediment metagenome TaxID=412755 RepID=A0A0F9HQV0_9ZZZZ
MTNLDISFPLSSTRAGYDPEREAARYAMNKELIADKYHYEKVIGKRRLDGALKLKELKPEHKQWISCFIQGMKGVEIAEQYNVAAITVYRVLSDPLAKALLGEFDEAFKNEFRSMFPLVANAIRDGLESAGIATRLKAVDRWTKVSGFIDGKTEEDKGEKKPEVMAAMRLRLVAMLQTTAGALPSNTPTQIEIEAVVVESS